MAPFIPYLPGKSRQAYCSYYIRETLIRYGWRQLLVCRKAVTKHLLDRCVLLMRWCHWLYQGRQLLDTNTVYLHPSTTTDSTTKKSRTTFGNSSAYFLHEHGVEDDIVIEPFIYVLMVIYCDVIMCHHRHVITSFMRVALAPFLPCDWLIGLSFCCFWNRDFY